MQDLQPHEQTALGGLLRMMIRSDGDFTEAEEATLTKVAEAFGGEAALWKIISQSAQDCPDDDAIRTAAAKVESPPVRSLIRKALADVAAGDGVADAEDELLAWLDQLWT